MKRISLISLLLIGLLSSCGAGQLFGPRIAPTPTNTQTPTQTPSPTPSPTPQFRIGSEWIRPADGMTMMYVPEGEFLMGSTGGIGFNDEYPQHKVYLDAFWIDKTEVTNAMYALCVQAGTCQPPVDYSSAAHRSYYGNPQFDNYPVIYMLWNDASTYCQWAGTRLPTEAEWEKAARGTDGRTYPWGNSDPNCSLGYFNQNYCMGENKELVSYSTTAVGLSPDGASPYGALDMVGNAWEWVSDWYGYSYYSISPSNNPQGPSYGVYRVERGGRFDYRASVRAEGDPSYTSPISGFRCVRSQSTTIP